MDCLCSGFRGVVPSGVIDLLEISLFGLSVIDRRLTRWRLIGLLRICLFLCSQSELDQRETHISRTIRRYTCKSPFYYTTSFYYKFSHFMSSLDITVMIVPGEFDHIAMSTLR